jgi:hypothetical protein
MERAVMTRMVLSAIAVVAFGATVSASGGKAFGGGATATELTMRIPDESAPAGAMVQMKVLTTEVTPISGGRPGFGYDSAFFGAVVTASQPIDAFSLLCDEALGTVVPVLPLEAQP